MPAEGPHGLWVAGEHADYVFVDDSAPPLRRAQILGHPVTRSKSAMAAANAAVKPAAAAQAVPSSVDKIIVSNLPTDVNEAQIKVYNTRRNVLPIQLTRL